MQVCPMVPWEGAININNLLGSDANYTSDEIDAMDYDTALCANLKVKSSLYKDSLQFLIDDEIEEADRILTQCEENSNGTWQGIQVQINASGLTAADLLNSNTIKLLESLPSALQNFENTILNSVLFPMHPEHYLFIEEPLGVVETWNDLPTRTSVGVCTNDDDVPDFVKPHVDSSAILSIKGHGDIFDGPVVTYLLEQFVPTSEGLTFDLRVWYPGACPHTYLEWHTRHFSVEFTNLALLIKSAL